MEDTPQPSTYERLSAPFSQVFELNGYPYLSGEQVISRLNDVLGPAGWSFFVKEQGLNEEAQEYWVLGTLTAIIGDQRVTREQYGSQKINRTKETRYPINIGNDLKGASTDALKKCASLIGVGLYLTERDPNKAPQQYSGGGGGSYNQAPRSAPTVPEGTALICSECDEPLEETRFKDGKTWSPQDLAGYGTHKHGRVLCMKHYRKANEALKAQQTAADGPLPF